MKIKFPKLYRYDRKGEHCYIAIPFAKGVFLPGDSFEVRDGERPLPVQTKVTSRYEDGSVRYLFVRFMADLPGNREKELEGRILRGGTDRSLPENGGIRLAQENGTLTADCGGAGLKLVLKDGSDRLFEEVKAAGKTYTGELFEGPFLTDQKGRQYGIRLNKWQIAEEGPLLCVFRCMGTCEPVREKAGAEEKGKPYVPGRWEELPSFEAKVTVYAEKPWMETSFRLINSTSGVLDIKSLVFALKSRIDAQYDPDLKEAPIDRGDSVGEGRLEARGPFIKNTIYDTNGVKELPMLETMVDLENGRTCVGSSNYKTNFSIAENLPVERIVDAKYLMGEANEHFAEVFYGTFFTDYTDLTGGVCATVFQAQQNFPKAVKSSPTGIYVYLVPEGAGQVVMQSGMSREQKFLLHFHEAGETLSEIDNRSLIYQMPDKPFLSPEVFRDAGVMPEIFVDPGKMNTEVEISLIAKCDSHTRSYGMLNFGDGPDPNYTKQGRGKGFLVWTNNEYDFPHACALQYARTGERRFLDYMIASASHWMDVDVCHYSHDPLLLGGQWEHTRGHVVDGVMVCSHEWVEGLLDHYHLTGDERALETALGIGENILRLLETPMYQVSGESNARETGWALRSLTALYVETHDRKWVEKAEWIVAQFEKWAGDYGGWIAPYTDNTTIRVGFMISVAVGSLMRYYRVFPSEKLRKLILDAVEDLLDNCYMENGLFYYKELPSLNRLGNNTLLVEAMTIGYELTGDIKYLLAGKATFWNAIRTPAGAVVGEKQIVEDAVLVKSGPPKNFAQSFLPLALYYRAATEAGVL